MSGRVAMTPSSLTLRIRADRAHRRAACLSSDRLARPRAAVARGRPDREPVIVRVAYDRHARVTDRATGGALDPVRLAAGRRRSHRRALHALLALRFSCHPRAARCRVTLIVTLARFRALSGDENVGAGDVRCHDALRWSGIVA